VKKISGGGLRLPVAFRSSNERRKLIEDRISNIAVSNGILRIKCVAVGQVI